MDTVFGLDMLAKSRYVNLRFGIPYVQILLYYIYSGLMEILKILVFTKKCTNFRFF